MLHVRHIDSFDLPELAPYRTLRYQLEHRRQGIFVAEGEKSVRRLIASRLSVVSVVMPPKLFGAFEAGLLERGEEISVFLAPKKLLETLTGFSMYQGIMAVGKTPPPLRLEALLEGAPKPLLLVAADGLSNAQNMGSLLRNCAAFNAGGLLVGETSCSPFLRRAITASAGTFFHVPIVELSSLGAALQQLCQGGIRRIAAHPSAARSLLEANLTGHCCLIMGSEGYGISPAILEQCDEALAIPMPSGVDSLNVGSASAVFLYEALRQRQRCSAP